MKQWVKRSILFIVLCMTFWAAGFQTFAAGGKITVNVAGKYGQTEARSMLEMINDFRKGSEAWYWNEDNTTKTTCANLDELQYDYELEQSAMKRAMEIAISYSHTRPNGENCWTVYPTDRLSKGENIAAGYSTAGAVFEGWQETNENYAGQGHRRNMLNNNFTAVGIGHVYYQGIHYWVQEFGNPASSVADPGVNDRETAVTVEVLASNITASSVAAESESLVLSYGTKQDLPEISVRLQLSETWPKNRWNPVTVSDISWSSSDAAVATVENGKIIANKSGGATLTATVPSLDKSVAVAVTVEPRSVADGQLTLSQDVYDYDGSEKTPQVSLVVDGRTLEIGSDYEVSYRNHTEAGTRAEVIVNGKGNYTGRKTAFFEIVPADLTGVASVAAIEEMPYMGQAIIPAVEVSYKDTKLGAEDYTLSCTDNVNVGSAMVTVTGKGNYRGSVTASFEITQRSLDEVPVPEILDQPYTGTAISPELNMT